MKVVDVTHTGEHPKEPNLPPELEREIFEIAGRDDYAMAYSLIQVAKRVHEWIEPILYRVLCFDGYGTSSSPSPLLEAFNSSASLAVERQSKYVRYYFHNAADHVLNSLYLRTSIVDLALWHTHDSDVPIFMEFMSTLHLRRLSIYPEVFTSHPEFWSNSNIPMYQSLTHLDILDSQDQFSRENWSVLVNFPRLTHIAFDGANTGDTIAWLLGLEGGLQLQLVISSTAHPRPEHPVWVMDDLRFIIMPYPSPPAESWLQGTSRGSGKDFWALAEDLQREKRKNRAQA